MAALQPLLSDREFENWVKAGLALQSTKDGIVIFVEDIINDLYKYIFGSVQPINLCNSCSTQNIIKCEPNNNICRYDDRKMCRWHDQNNVYRPCPVRVCDKIRDEILANHRYGMPNWKNTDARLWCSNKWKIAVCYMSEGYSQTMSAKETDLPGLLNVVINYTYSQNYVASNLSHYNSIFIKARTSRNNILHNPRQRLTDIELRAHIATFTSVLSDTKSLATDTNAITAITKLNQIMTNTISITTQHAGQILAEARQAIKEAGQEEIDNLKAEKDTIIARIDEKNKETLSNFYEARTETLDAIEKTHQDITNRLVKQKEESLDTMKKKQGEFTDDFAKSEKLALKRIAKENDHSLDAVKKTKYECIEQLKRQTDEHTQTLTEKTNATLEDIASLRNEDTDIKKHEAVQEMRQELLTLYQEEARFLTTPIYPLIEHRNRNIKDVYVSPAMRTLDKETMKPEKEVSSIKDIFRENSKNIYVVGDAGMGKSSLCKKIVSDWCKSKSDNETSLSTDQKAMQIFSFVFYISLRDCYSDLNVIDMIKHQLLDELYEFDDTILIYLLRNEKCLIVLDGLDEWIPNVIPNTSYSSYSNEIIPFRNGVRNCSILTTTRPWKLEAIRLQSSQIDKQIELLGIGEHSHKAFVQQMVRHMNPEIDSDYILSSFLEEVEKKNLNEFLSIPVILKHLVCIWIKSKKLRKTKTSVYSQMLNLLLEVANSRLQHNANYKAFKSTDNLTNYRLPKCFTKDKKCNEFVSILCPLSKLAFETLLSDTPESSLVFKISTTKVHGLTHEQVNICLDIGILSKSKYLKKQNYLEEHTKISFLHKTYQEFLAALWISLEINDENKQTNLKKFKKKCSTIKSMFELSEFLIFVSGMNSKIACVLSEHTRDITTQSDINRKYRQSMNPYDEYIYDVQRVQELTISCMKEGWRCSHSDRHFYLEDTILKKPILRDEEEIIAVENRLFKINKKNIKSMSVNDVSLQSHDNSLLEVSGLEKLMFRYICDMNIIKRLIYQSENTLLTLVFFDSVFKNVSILSSTRCLTRLSLKDMQLTHIIKLDLMSFLSRTRRLQKIVLDWIKCDDCDYGQCSSVLDLRNHEQLECLWLWHIDVAIDAVVNVTNMVKCKLGCIKPVMSFVNVTQSLHNASNLKSLELGGTETYAETAAVVECISHLKHLERLELLDIDMGYNELVLSSYYRNLEYVMLYEVIMTKRTLRGFVDSIFNCNQAVCVVVFDLKIKPVEVINDTLDNVRQCSRCQIKEDEGHEEGVIGWFEYKTIPGQKNKLFN